VLDQPGAVPFERDATGVSVICRGRAVVAGAGLAAAVYGSSEGLDTLVVERDTIGGQAGSSSMIRDYLGFPRGVGGSELAQRAYEQAWGSAPDSSSVPR
jgi:hypothetical protein